MSVSKVTKNQKGQSFVEFIFLLLILFTLSFTLMRGFNFGISELWKSYVSTIAHPTESVIEF